MGASWAAIEESCAMTRVKVIYIATVDKLFNVNGVLSIPVKEGRIYENE